MSTLLWQVQPLEPDPATLIDDAQIVHAELFVGLSTGRHLVDAQGDEFVSPSPPSGRKSRPELTFREEFHFSDSSSAPEPRQGLTAPLTKPGVNSEELRHSSFEDAASGNTHDIWLNTRIPIQLARPGARGDVCRRISGSMDGFARRNVAIHRPGSWRLPTRRTLSAECNQQRVVRRPPVERKLPGHRREDSDHGVQ